MGEVGIAGNRAERPVDSIRRVQDGARVAQGHEAAGRRGDIADLGHACREVGGGPAAAIRGVADLGGGDSILLARGDEHALSESESRIAVEVGQVANVRPRHSVPTGENGAEDFGDDEAVLPPHGGAQVAGVVCRLLGPCVQWIGDRDGFRDGLGAAFHVGYGQADLIGAAGDPVVGDAGRVLMDGAVLGVPEVGEGVSVGVGGGGS